MFGFRFVFEGLQKALQGLTRTHKGIAGPEMQKTMQRAVTILEVDAKRFAPVDRGRLRGSITNKVVSLQGEKGIHGVVGSSVFYAPYQESGTGSFAGNAPHWPPGDALEGWARRHGVGSGYVVAAAIGRRGGLRGKFFLRKSFRKNRKKIEAMFDALIRRLLAD